MVAYIHSMSPSIKTTNLLKLIKIMDIKIKIPFGKIKVGSTFEFTPGLDFDIGKQYAKLSPRMYQQIYRGKCVGPVHRIGSWSAECLIKAASE